MTRFSLADAGATGLGRRRSVVQAQYGVDCECKIVVALRDHAACVMRAERDSYLVPRVAPVGVVPVALGEHRHHRHETECFSKVFELEFTMQFAVGMVPTLRRAAHARKAMRKVRVVHATRVLVVGTARGARASSAMR